VPPVPPQPPRQAPAAKPPATPAKAQPVEKVQAEAAEQPSPKAPSPPGPRALNDPSRLRNPDDWYLFGLELMDRGDSERAARAFQNALKRRPNDAEFHAALARAYAETEGFNRQSILEFEEAIALKPDSADYQAELGVFYLKHNYIEAARRHVDLALGIDSKNRMANKAKLRIEEKKK